MFCNNQVGKRFIWLYNSHVKVSATIPERCEVGKLPRDLGDLEEDTVDRMFNGGHNRTHGQTAHHKCLDSFYFMSGLKAIIEKRGYSLPYTFTWIFGDTIIVTLFRDRLETCYFTGSATNPREIKDVICLEKVSANYGGQILYFKCPCCDRRSRILYLHWQHFKCRICAKLNYPSQQERGPKTTAYKMKKLLKRLEYERLIPFDDPEKLELFDIADCCPPRPKGMHTTTYHQLLLELGKLQKQYQREFELGVSKILKADFKYKNKKELIEWLS